MTKGLIYKSKCIINGKSYIGQTVLKLKQRKKQHIYNTLNNKFNTHFYNALKKYGIENFEWTIIEDNILESKLNEKEVFYIHNQNTFLNGYNMTKGGSISPMRYKEIRRKITGENHPGYGKSRSEETKQKIRNTVNTTYKNDITYRDRVSIETKKAMMNPDIREKLRQSNLGKKLSKTTKRKIAESRSKEYIVYSPENQIIYVKNLKNFCKENNLNNSSMCNVAKGRYKHHKKWRCKNYE